MKLAKMLTRMCCNMSRPTIRYYNKETGYEGKHYTKKTSLAMCSELGDMKYLREYINEAGGTTSQASGKDEL